MNNFSSLAAATETLPLGESLCVFRNDSHALCLLNRAASEVWQAKSLGQPDEAVARQLSERYGIGRNTARNDINALLASWQKSGLTAPAMPLPFAGNKSAPQRPVSSTDQLSPLDAFYGLAATKAGYGPLLRIKCHEPVLAALLEAVLRPFQIDCHELSDAARQPKNVIEIGSDATADDFCYWARLPDGAFIDRLDRSEARRMVLIEALLQRHGRQYTTAILHASAIELRGKAIVLAGASGAGKTSLTAALVAAGATYFGDDLLSLLPCGSQIGDFPSCLAFKQGSWQLVSKLFSTFKDCDTLTTRHIKVRYLDPATDTRPIAPRHQQIAVVILPQYEPGGAFLMNRLTPEETFNGLVASGSEPLGAPRSMRSLANLANNIPAYQMRFGKSDDAIKAILKLRQQS